MDDDINLDLSPTRKSAPGPKVGRRAFASAASFEARDVAADAEAAMKSRPVTTLKTFFVFVGERIS